MTKKEETYRRSGSGDRSGPPESSDETYKSSKTTREGDLVMLWLAGQAISNDCAIELVPLG